jgi:hypothetical protein
MLLMKAWLETRWRLIAAFAYPIALLALNYHHRAPESVKLLIGLGALVATGAMMLAGSGVKSQSPAGFPEGLAGSTQFTIGLPVSRRRLWTVRAAFGLAESFALAVVVGCLAWTMLPSLRQAAPPADFARLFLVFLLFLTAVYGAHLLCLTVVDEPLSAVYAGWGLTLLLWLLHQTVPALDIVRAWGAESPLVTHRLPWSQMAVIAGLAGVLAWGAVRVVETHEY